VLVFMARVIGTVQISTDGPRGKPASVILWPAL
jgi:hypothetical protein